MVLNKLSSKKGSSLPFPGYIQIKEKLANTTLENFSDEIIRREDGLPHLLLSDVNNLMLSIAHDFPEISKVYSIGKSFEGRDINVIELTSDKKKPKEEDKNEKPSTSIKLAQISDDEEMSEQEKAKADIDKTDEQREQEAQQQMISKDVNDGKPTIL